MGVRPASTTNARVSFVESFTQPDATILRADAIDASTALVENETDGLRKRPSIVVGADMEALAAVRTVHSPRSSTSLGSPRSPSAAGSSATTPKMRGAWRRKMLGSGWTGPMDAVFSVVGLLATMYCYGIFLRWNETRSDVGSRLPLADPVLPHLKALDYSMELSILVYGSLVAAFKYTHNKPDVFLEFCQTHAGVMWARMLALYLTPLEAPVGTVPLVDPIAHPDGVVLVRDLFFSGHTATTFGLFIGVRRHEHAWRVFFGLVTLVTAVLVLLQKAHYTIDVLAAPCFVHTVHSLVVTARQTIGAMLTKGEKHYSAAHFHIPTSKPKKL